MIVTVFAAVLLILHILFCLLVWVLVRLGLLDVKGHLLVFMLLVPVWGAVCVFALELRSVVYGDDLKDATLEALRNSDRVHRQLHVEGREGDAQTVPLEEALIVDASRERRKLMLSILNDDPEGYIPLLKDASLNDDGEVAHYAAAAMSQITKEADVKLQRLERAYAADESDGSALCEYCDYLGQYLDSGLAEGKAAQLQREQYARLLEQRLSASPDDQYLLTKAATARIELGDLNLAEDLISRLLKIDPHDDQALLLRLREASAAHDGELLGETLDLMEADGVYLSPASREAYEFWRGPACSDAVGPEERANNKNGGETR